MHCCPGWTKTALGVARPSERFSRVGSETAGTLEVKMISARYSRLRANPGPGAALSACNLVAD